MPEKFGFKCPNGHSFDAIAKLRARCPECGQMARRNFQAPVPKSSESESPIKTTSPVSFSKAANRKDTASGLKPDSISAKVKQPDSKIEKVEPKSSATSPTSIKKPTIVRQGLPQVSRTIKNPPPKTSGKTTTSQKATKSPVRRVAAKAGHTPTVTKPPTGSREHKVIEQTTDEPYWLKVKRQFGFNR